MAKYRRQWRALTAREKSVLIAAAVANTGSEGIGVVFGAITNSGLGAALFSAQLPPVGSFAVVLPFTIPRETGATSIGLDAGPSLTLVGAAGSMTLSSASNGVYYGVFPASISGPNAPLGTYTLSGRGGAGVGSFSVTATISANLALSNKSTLAQVDRSQPLTVAWTGGVSGGFVLLGGYSPARYAPLPPALSARGTRFICAEDAGKGSFTIPPFVLSRLWPTPDSSGVLFIAPNPLSQPLAIPGLASAWFLDASTDAVNVAFRVIRQVLASARIFRSIGSNRPFRIPPAHRKRRAR